MKKRVLKQLTAILLLGCFLMSDISSISVFAQMDVQNAIGETVLTEETVNEETTFESSTEADGEVASSEKETETVSVRETESTVVMESTTETESVEETVEETDAVKETETVDLMETETADETENLDNTGIKKITGFVGLNEYDSRIDTSVMTKPSLEELVSVMPKTLKVYLDGGTDATEIEVTWFCVGEDYEKSDLRYYQFSPLFDEEKYILDESLDLLKDIPYIGVFLAEGDGTAAAALYDSSANEREIFNFLMNELELNQAAASGILANIYCESGFNPTASGDSGSSYGICQWHNGRKTNLINYCKANGYDYTSLTGQLYYLKYELVNNYRSIYNYMLRVNNTEAGAYTAGYYWCYNFEIPANKETISISRGNLAKNTYWPKYASVTTVPMLRGAENIAGGVTVTWYEYKDAIGYYLYRKTNGGKWERIAVIGNGDDISYTDTKVSSGTTYTYTIRALLSNGLSGYNSQASILYLKDPVVKGANACAGGIQVTWDKIAGAAGYRVYRRANGSTWQRVATVTGGSITSYTDKQVSSGTTYTYTVRACSGNTMSDYVSQKKIIYLKDPEIASVSNVPGGVKVTWNKISGAAGYYVYRKTGGGKWIKLTSVSGGSSAAYIDTDAESGKTYTYTVRAYSQNAMSIYNSQKSIIYLKDPTVLKISNANGGVAISWDKIAGAKGYFVYRKTSGGSWTRIADISSGTKVSYTDTKAASGKTYAYTVRAFSGNTISSYKSQRSIVYLAVPVPSVNVNSTYGATLMSVSWTKVAGAAGYYVYRKTEGGSWIRIADITSGSKLSYGDTTAAGGKTYTYTVRAYKGNAISYYDTKGASGKLAERKLINYKTTENVNYRKGPGTSYKIMGVLDKGTTVQVVSGETTKADGYTWYTIFIHGEYFYVCSDYLKKV